MSTKTKTHKTMKLPKGLPKLPLAPTGCVWEYMGTRWNGSADNYIYIHDTEHEWKHSEGKTSAGPCHYCRAVKHPAPAKKQPKAKAVKAVRLFSPDHLKKRVQLGGGIVLAKKADCFKPTPVAVLDISDTNALVEQVANALLNEEKAATYHDQARSVLASLGIIPARKAKK